jgi:hypothetical protein
VKFAWRVGPPLGADAEYSLTVIERELFRQWKTLAELEVKVERLKSALRYLRRKIDGYDGTFEACGFEEFKESP